MAITSGDRDIDAGKNDPTPEQEREIEAREECARRGIDPDEICADGGVEAWMVVEQEMRQRAFDRRSSRKHQEPWDLNYDALFKCIAAATKVVAGAVSISVHDFRTEYAYQKLAAVASSTSSSTGSQTDEA